MPIVQGNPISILVLKGEKGDSGEGAGSISFANITGNPEDNGPLSEALSTKLEAGDLDNVSHKQDVKDLTNNNKMNLIGIFNQLGIDIKREILLIAFEKFFPVGSNIIWNNTKDPNKIFPYNKGTWELTSRGRSIVGRDPESFKYPEVGAEVGEEYVKMPQHRHKVTWFGNYFDGKWGDTDIYPAFDLSNFYKKALSDNSVNSIQVTSSAFITPQINDGTKPAPSSTARIIIGDAKAPFDEDAKIPMDPLGEVKSIWTRIK